MLYLKEKLRIIYLPTLVGAVVLSVVYSFLHWLLFIYLYPFVIPELILNVVIPFVIALVFFFTWMRKRIRIFKPAVGKDQPRFAIAMVVLATVMAIIIPVQNYLETATGRLSQLKDISELGTQKESKYYTLNKYYIDKKDFQTNFSWYILNNTNKLDLNMYVVVPILKEAADTTSGKIIAWLGVKYERISIPEIDEEEKQNEKNDFIQECNEQFKYDNINDFVYLKNEGYFDEGYQYNIAIEKSRKYKAAESSVLLPVNEAFSERNGNGLWDIIKAFGISVSVMFLFLCLAKVDPAELKTYEAIKNQ